MSSEEAKNIVSAGLERRRIARTKQEAELEAQARQLRITINDNHATRTMTEKQKAEAAIAEREKRAAARREARAAEAAREFAAEKAVRYYGLACLIILLLCALTKLPVWAAITLAVGIAVFPAVYILRLYLPLGGYQKEGCANA